MKSKRQNRKKQNKQENHQENITIHTKYEKLNSVLIKVMNLMEQQSCIGSSEEEVHVGIGGHGEENSMAEIDNMAANDDDMVAGNVHQDIMWMLQSISNLYICIQDGSEEGSIDFILNHHQNFMQLLLGFCFTAQSSIISKGAQKQHLQLECLGFVSNILNAANPEPPFNHHFILFTKFKTCQLAVETLFSLLALPSLNADADSLAKAEQVAHVLSSFAENTLEAMDAISNMDFIARLVDYCNLSVREIQKYMETRPQQQQQDQKQSKKLFQSNCNLLRALLQLLNTVSEENDTFSKCTKEAPTIISSLFQGLEESSKMASCVNSSSVAPTSATTLAYIEPKSQLLELPLLFSSILFNISLTSLSEPQQEQLSLKLSERIHIALSFFNLNEMTHKVLADANVLEKMRIKQEQQHQDEKQKQLNEFIIDRNKETEYIQASKKHLQVIQFALELLTNVFSSPESSLSSAPAAALSPNGTAETDLVEEDETTLENTANQDGMELDFDDDIEIDHDDNNIMSSLLSPALASTLYSLLLNLELPHLQSQTLLLPAASKAYIYSLEKVYLRSLSCLSNIYLVGGGTGHVKENAESVWRGVFGQVKAYSGMNPVPLELVEASVTLLFSMIQTVQVVRYFYSFLVEKRYISNLLSLTSHRIPTVKWLIGFYGRLIWRLTHPFNFK